jgi:hypothetical protein
MKQHKMNVLEVGRKEKCHGWKPRKKEPGYNALIAAVYI